MTKQGSKSEEQMNAEPEMEQALGAFRASVRAWGEAEMGRARQVAALRAPRTPSPSTPRWTLWSQPLIAAALGCAMLAAGVAVPIELRHRARIEAAALAAHAAELKRNNDAAAEARAAAISDDELLSDVDTDLAQGEPDALEPLASMMHETPRVLAVAKPTASTK